jgi:hypothetical protein
VDLGHVPKVFRELRRGLHVLETKSTLSVDIVRVELNLNGLPIIAIHISGFHGKDGRVVELNVLSQVDTVFSYGRLLQMF